MSPTFKNILYILHLKCEELKECHSSIRGHQECDLSRECCVTSMKQAANTFIKSFFILRMNRRSRAFEDSSVTFFFPPFPLFFSFRFKSVLGTVFKMRDGIYWRRRIMARGRRDLNRFLSVKRENSLSNNFIVWLFPHLLSVLFLSNFLSSVFFVATLTHTLSLPSSHVLRESVIRIVEMGPRDGLTAWHFEVVSVREREKEKEGERKGETRREEPLFKPLHVRCEVHSQTCFTRQSNVMSIKRWRVTDMTCSQLLIILRLRLSRKTNSLSFSVS